MTDSSQAVEIMKLSHYIKPIIATKKSLAIDRKDMVVARK